MKKLKLISMILGIVLISGCSFPKVTPEENKNISQENEIKKVNTNNYLGSYYKGNYIWGGAMNLARNELNENILHEKLQLNTEDQTALQMVEKFNNSPFSKNDLDEKSYYVKAGYGQETLNQINRESREKFPQKSFDDLDMQLDPTDIISYAYFLKEIEYLKDFKEGNAYFQNTKVKGFYAEDREQKQNITILDYQNDDNFIIALKLKDNQDQIFLAKGFDMTAPQEIVKKINKLNKQKHGTMANNDIFESPKIQINYYRQYTELLNIPLKNINFTEYSIAKMFENIKFDMDQKGARVENEAVMMMMATSAGPGSKQPKIRKFVLDKPFWIVFKRTDSNNPYFILGVNNTEIMEKFEQ